MIYLNEYFENYASNNYEDLDECKYEILKSEISKLINNDKSIKLCFDGGFGYTTNFIERIIAFIKERYGNEKLLDKIEIISNDEPSIVDYVYNMLKGK